MHKDFVSLKEICPTIIVRADYAGFDNFVGRPIPGYNSLDSLMLISAADQLKRVSGYFNEKGYGLFIFDAYRPRKAVEFFGEWAKSEEKGNKEKFFPHLTKQDLIDQCFISMQSSHSRGSTIDMSLYNLDDGKELDMGTIFDFFDETSFTESKAVSENAIQNRVLLKEGMEKFSFKNYYKEWWHFRLEDEQYPDTFFNFDIG